MRGCVSSFNICATKPATPQRSVVIRAPVEGSRHETFKVTPRDPSTALGVTDGSARIPPLNIDRSCRRCNRTPCDATLRSRSAEPPHLQAGLDRAGNFRKLFATSRTRVCLPPPPAGGNKHSHTKISGVRDWPLPDRHHIE